MSVINLEMEKISCPEEWEGTFSEINNLLNGFEFDQMQPILINKDNVIIDGVKRYLACVRLGIEQIPVEYQRKTSRINIGTSNYVSNLRVA